MGWIGQSTFGALLLFHASEATAAEAHPTGRLVQAPARCLVPDVALDERGVLHMVYGLDHHAYYVRSTDVSR